jgi:SAM-dependent methyltransferase
MPPSAAVDQARSAQARLMVYKPPMTVRSMLGKVYRSSLADAVAGVRGFVKDRVEGTPLPQPVTGTFVRSQEYDELMSRYLPCDGSFDLHEAQNETHSYNFRHRVVHNRLGVFRWRGMQRHRARILDIVENAQGRVLDFGGAAGPLGLGSVVVDQLEVDVFGRPVTLHSLAAARGGVSVVFSSHAMEHVPALDDTLREIRDTLEPGGTMILHVPSYFCERWRAGRHTHRSFNDHVWTFGLEDKPLASELPSYANIASRVARHMAVELAEYCGDDSIFLLARRTS